MAADLKQKGDGGQTVPDLAPSRTNMNSRDRHGRTLSGEAVEKITRKFLSDMNCRRFKAVLTTLRSWRFESRGSCQFAISGKILETCPKFIDS